MNCSQLNGLMKNHGFKIIVEKQYNTIVKRNQHSISFMFSFETSLVVDRR